MNFLAVATQLLDDEGWAALSLDRIADQNSYHNP